MQSLYTVAKVGASLTVGAVASVALAIAAAAHAAAGANAR
jgi:hypothetical protein